MVTASPSNSDKSPKYEKDFDQKDIYYNSGEGSPYRENPVPVDYYRQIKSDLLKQVKTKTEELNRLSYQLDQIRYDKSVLSQKIIELEEKIIELEEKIQIQKKSKAISICLFILICAGLFYSGRNIHRQVRSGEIGFTNSETALRKHLRSINQAEGAFISCRIEPQSTTDANICSIARNFCIVSSPSTYDRYFCCSSGDVDVNGGCRVVSGTITNGIFRPISN